MGEQIGWRSKSGWIWGWTLSISHKAWRVVKLRVLTQEEVEKYRHEERLDGGRDIAHFLGIARETWDRRYKQDMHNSGILFERSAFKTRPPASLVHSKWFTYKRLVISWLMKRGGVL